MSKQFALAGNPNCGKTTLFNELTGARQHVGNWPGVTVDKKSGETTFEGEVYTVIDLPGIYSLTAYTQEELVTRDYLLSKKTDCIINIINANVLERNLYLTVQFLELGVPLVLTLNMMDEVEKSGKKIDIAKLQNILELPVIPTVARTGKGKEQVIDAASKIDPNRAPLYVSYGADLDLALEKMEKIIEEHDFSFHNVPARWVCIKFLELDEHIIKNVRELNSPLADTLEKITRETSEHVQSTLNTLPDALIADYRYGFIASIIRDIVYYPETNKDRLAVTDKIDNILTHKLFGPLFMIAVIYALYYLTIYLGAIPMGWVESFFGLITDTVNNILPEGQLRSLIVDGIIGGVGGIVGFVPLIMLMFLCIAALEDSGYIARMAYMLDKIFRVFGLHGNSVLPFIVSGGIAGGCAVPGVMATRTLRSPKEKIATLLVAPYMNCGAKMPVFLMLTTAFFPQSAATLMLLITLFAWVAALLVARVLRSTIIKGESTPFVMELPPYRIPTLRGVLIHTWERSAEYLKKAGTIILGISILIWASLTYPGLSEEQIAPYTKQTAQLEIQLETAKVSTQTNMIAEIEIALTNVQNAKAEAALKNSVAGRFGTSIEGVTQLAGFDWRTNIALASGIAAKEVIVSTLGTAYSLGSTDPEDTGNLETQLKNDETFTKATALALITFVILYAPCFITVVAIARESSWKWASFSVIFNTILGFTLSVIVYQIAKLF